MPTSWRSCCAGPSRRSSATTGESVYFRLSTRPIDQPRRTIDPDLAEAIVAGAYWLREPGPGAELAIAYCGAVAPEALAAL